MKRIKLLLATAFSMLFHPRSWSVINNVDTKWCIECIDRKLGFIAEKYEYNGVVDSNWSRIELYYVGNSDDIFVRLFRFERLWILLAKHVDRRNEVAFSNDMAESLCNALDHDDRLEALGSEDAH